jgi:hypothetical protein
MQDYALYYLNFDAGVVAKQELHHLVYTDMGFVSGCSVPSRPQVCEES